MLFWVGGLSFLIVSIFTRPMRRVKAHFFLNAATKLLQICIGYRKMASNREITSALHTLDKVLRNGKDSGGEYVQISSAAVEQLRELPLKLSQRAAQAVAVIAEAPVTEEKWVDPPGETRREKLNNLFRVARDCEACRELGTLRETMVFATGNPEADLMFVGEAPGEEEEKLKKPFVGPAGQKLDQIIQAMGLKREEVYISNIVKFRPIKGDPRFQGSGNRKPTPNEMAVSVKTILSEIRIVKPKVIVVLGGTAAEGLLGVAGSVSRMRNQFYDLGGIPAMVTYHPNHLLRQESEPDKELAKREKRKVWEDMLLVMEKMGLQISEAQQGYFS